MDIEWSSSTSRPVAVLDVGIELNFLSFDRQYDLLSVFCMLNGWPGRRSAFFGIVFC